MSTSQRNTGSPGRAKQANSSATVVYDEERPPANAADFEDLEPPDIDAVLRKKRKWYHRITRFELPRGTQMVLTGTSIVLSAVQANGVYCWPTYGPVVIRQLRLSVVEAQTIAVGGILGVYFLAAPLGSLVDRYGPRTGSFLAAVLSAMGYLGFAALLGLPPDTPNIHIWLTAAYFCVGSATVGSYFACLTTASLSFPEFPTLSLSVPLSLLGLSSLVLSSFSNLSTFHTETNELDARKFLVFLGILCPAVNLFGAVFMKVVPPAPIEEQDLEIPDSPISQLLHLDEHTPLLIGGPEAARQDAEEELRGKEHKWTAWKLFKDWEGFWVFGSFLALCIGPSETVIASIGSFLTSLLPPTTEISSINAFRTSGTFGTFASASPFTLLSTASDAEALRLRNKHVFILSLTGTIARLLTGITADCLSPPLVAVPAPPSDDPDAPTHLFVRKRKQILARSLYAAISALILAAIFGWSAGFLKTEGGLWVLSAGTGGLYGALFTLSPSIVSAHFGPTNFGLAWGMVSYFAALGSVIFSYVYAYLSQAIASRSGSAASQCYGPECFSGTLGIAAGCCVVSAIGFAWIGRRWRV